MLLGQELKFKNKLCNLKLGTFFSALPGLGASALYLSLRPVTVGSGREGYELLSFYFLPFNFYDVVSAMFSRQSSVLVVLDFLDRNEDG